MALVCAGVLIASAFGLAGCADYGTAVYAGPGYGYGPYYGPSYGYVGIAFNDRPYYLHGRGYYVGNYYYGWRPGYWHRSHGRRVWIHGDYVRR
jgi:hypothetical protein